MSVVKHRFNVEQYRLMGEAGIFSEDARVELMDGEVVEMAPIGDRHVESVMRLNRLTSRWALMEGGPDLFVSVQNPLSLGEHWEPQPDLALVRRLEDRSGVPAAEEVLLVIEVAATSLDYDREFKLPLYAASGIPEVWLVDLNSDTVEVYSAPASGGYEESARFRRGDRMVSATLPDLIFEVAEAMPPDE